MFDYGDPGGTLTPAAALTRYRQLLHSEYRDHAKRALSAFTLLEAFEEMAPGTQPRVDTVEWSAFPITAPATPAQIDSQRFQFQDEYVEWHVERSAGAVAQITFVTDFLEYYEALATVGMGALVAAIQAVIPGADPTAAELFGPGAPPTQPESRAMRFRNFARQNPWNNGEKGILCLAQQFNTLGALFSLVGRGAIPNLAVPSGAICGTLDEFCGSNRNSDPSIATAVQDLSRAGRGLSLQDPVGIEIVRLVGVWARDGNPIDINDPNANGGLFTISRTGRRAVLRNVQGLTVDNDPITTGAQVAASLTVRARVISAPEADLPVWSRVGQESSARLAQVAGGEA